MHSIQIDINIYDKLISYLQSLPQEGLKLKKLEKKVASFPHELMVSTVEEVQERAYGAEKTVGLTEDEYNKEYDIIQLIVSNIETPINKEIYE